MRALQSSSDAQLHVTLGVCEAQQHAAHTYMFLGERRPSKAVSLPLATCFLSCRYDGQTFVKPPEVLMRDRLLGTYEVKPVLGKLKNTLLGAGGLLLTCAVLLFGVIKAGTDADGMYGKHTAGSFCNCTSAMCCLNFKPTYVIRQEQITLGV